MTEHGELIVSLKEDDALKLGYIDRTKWEDSIRISIKKACKEIGISSENLKWVAAMHKEEKHPHVHIMFWEKEPTIAEGQISKKELNDMKKIFIKEIYKEHNQKLNLQKTVARDLILEKGKEDFKSLVNRMKTGVKEAELILKSEQGTIGEIVPKLYPDNRTRTIRKIQNTQLFTSKKGKNSI